MVVSFSAEQPTRYKYDKSKVTSQCDKETDIIGLEEWRMSLKNKKSDDNNNEQLDNDNTNEKRSSPVITKQNKKKWSSRMYLDEDENTSNTSPITGKRNTSPISSKFSSTNTKTNNSTLPILRGSKKEQTIKSKKKKKKRNMLDSDSSSEEESFIDKESFGILKLKKRVRIDQEKKKLAAAEQFQVEQHHETEQQTIDVGELKGNVSNAASSNDGIDHHETATLVDKEKSQSAAIASSEVDKSTSISSIDLHNNDDSSLALIGEARHTSESAAAVDLESIVTTDCGGEDDKLLRICGDIDESTSKESADAVDQLTIALPKEEDDMEVEVIEDQPRVKSS